MKVSYEEQVKGRTVIDSAGRAVGQVDALYLDADSAAVGLRVATLRIKLHSSVADEIGVPRGTFHAGTIEVSALAVQAVGDAVILNVNIESLVQPRLPDQPEAH